MSWNQPKYSGVPFEPKNRDSSKIVHRNHLFYTSLLIGFHDVSHEISHNQLGVETPPLRGLLVQASNLSQKISRKQNRSTKIFLITTGWKIYGMTSHHFKIFLPNFRLFGFTSLTHYKVWTSLFLQYWL